MRATTLSNDWLLWLALGFMTGAIFMVLLTPVPQPVCQEDEAWIPADHRIANAIEDSADVSRMCVNIEELTQP